jgi:hypothetical protein
MAITRNEHEYLHWQAEETKIINDRPVRFRDVCVYEIRMGDVEDPDLLIASPIWDWQQSEAGKFIMEHAVDKPYWARHLDYNSYGHVYRIMARLNEQHETFWRLKWGGLSK